MNIQDLCLQEGWEVTNTTVRIDGKDYPLAHPIQLYLKLYREATIPVEKLRYFKRCTEILWPSMIITSNAWQDRMFKAHCDAWKHIVFAGGGGIGKSVGAAMIATIAWLSNPKRNGIIISSTTLDSLESRIWGYVMKLIDLAEKETGLPLPFRVIQGKPPKVLYPGQKDKICGMFAAAIREGTQERTLATIIGRHPPGALIMILDEATDISPNALEAQPNLDQGTEFFQLIAIGNSNSKHDLHGALATPKDGWDSISPMNNSEWLTTHEKGICLYFNPFDSPAIHEKDPIKKAAISKFLITKEKIEAKAKEYGKDSAAYYRFILGFWKPSSIEETIMTPEFMRENNVFTKTEWSGSYPLKMVAGLDPAISAGQKGCVLRLAVLGQDSKGSLVLDYRDNELLFYIDISTNSDLSPELQLTNQVLEVLNRFGISLYHLAIDATGLGRALAELIRIKANSVYSPLKVISSRAFAAKEEKEDGNYISVPPLEQWSTFRTFIQHKQIKGLDEKTAVQLYSRRVIHNTKTNKQTLEDKVSYVSRMAAINPKLAHSPNEADGAALALQAAVRRLGFIAGASAPLPKRISLWEEKYQLHKQLLTEVSKSVKLPSPTAGFGQSIEQITWEKNK